MDYKEKYEQALERAKILVEKLESTHIKGFVYHIFPELKESEGEKIRREIISFLKDFEKDHYRSVNFNPWIAWLEKQGENKSTEDKTIFAKCFPELKESKDERIRKTIYGWIYTEPSEFFDNGFSKEEMIAWVEKQSERKTTDKVEPKFKVGNWYQCTKDFFGKGVTFDKNTAYYCAKEGCLQNEYGCHIAIVKDLYDNFKLWTIEDANDGDVLDCEGCEYLLFKSFSNTDGRIKLYCWYNVQTNSFHGRGTDSKLRQEANIHPATKEQRDLLFSKMRESGYEWDSEKKELKKIEPKILGADDILPYLGNNQVQDILEDMGMLDDNGQCPHTAEEIFKAGMEHAFNLNREDTSSVKLDADEVIEWLTANVRLYTSLNFLYESNCPQGDVEVESLIKSFKKDFGL